MKKIPFLHRFVSLLIAVTLLTSAVISSPGGVVQAARLPQGVPLGDEEQAASGSGTAAESRLASPIATFRATLQVADARRLRRIQEIGAVELSRTGDELPIEIVVLATSTQLEALARIGIPMTTADALDELAEREPEAAPIFVAALQADVAARGAAPDDPRSRAAAEQGLRTALRTLDAGQRAAVAALTSLDDDGDGLTNTQERWWCTGSLVADSDGDGESDGTEVQKAIAWTRNLRAGPPDRGRPFAGWPMKSGDGNFQAGCLDGDQDGVPDLAERWMLGMNPNKESTDGDKFDDAQELFGLTIAGWGLLPRNEDTNFIGTNMPSWVKAPGNHPMVAAYPDIKVSITSDFTVQLVTDVTTEQNHSSSESRSFSTAKTEGLSTSESDTRTWNSWEETAVTSEARPDQKNQIAPTAALGYLKTGLDVTAGPVSCLWKEMELRGEISSCGNVWDNRSEHKASLKTAWSNSRDRFRALPWQARIAIGTASPIIPALSLTTKFSEAGLNFINITHEKNRAKKAYEDAKTQREKDEALRWQQELLDAVRQNGERASTNSDRTQVAYAPSFEISYPEQKIIPTRTETKGSSFGGAHTVTNERYEENTVTNGNQWGTTDGWRNATAVNSAHSADIWFSYKVRNSGTDYAMGVTALAFNIYIGDDLNPACTLFVGSDQCGTPPAGGGPLFTNLAPGAEVSFTAHRIPLSLDQLKLIDLGGTLRVTVARLNYGTDELFYEDARKANVLVAIEDGVDDGDQSVDSYLIPTWADGDTVQNVIARYFPMQQYDDGSYRALWTPEIVGGSPKWCEQPRRYGTSLQVWCRHALSTSEWWNIYLDNLGDGTSDLAETAAAPNSTVLFRFHSDSDGDGFFDEREVELGTDPHDPESYPAPQLLAGLARQPMVNNVVTVTASLLNSGIDDSVGIRLIMIAPDDSTTILNNTVGGAGRVNAGKQVIVGSSIKLPTTLPGNWGASDHARPAVGGYFTGAAERTYTFTVSCANPGGCDVGAGAWSVNWSNGIGESGALNFGAGYKSPSLLAVAQGVQLSLLSGRVYNGESFTVAAKPPLDTFSYRINRTPYTEPRVIVSYNDPQGNHRFVIPPDAASLTAPTQTLTTFAGTMLQDPGVEIMTAVPFSRTAQQTMTLMINNSTGVTLTNARVYVSFINVTGTVAAEFPATYTLLTGPSVFTLPWTTSTFSPTFRASEDYIALAFLTDLQGNILDSGGRPLSSFQVDPKPTFAMSNVDVDWDFGTAAHGAVLKRTMSIGNAGRRDLLTYVAEVPGLSLSQKGSRAVGPADVTDYELAMDTTQLPVGAYDRTITIRTSDPARPTQNVRVRGTITAGAPDIAGGLQRPLDVDVTVTGGQSQGTWVTYTHLLGPDAATLHPVKVYDANYATLLGVGQVATDFSAGTASADMFGDGRDGPMPSSGNLDNANGAAFGVVTVGISGNVNITVSDAYGIDRINPGDVVLIHQTQGTSAGVWELNKAASDFTGTGTFSLQKPLANTYSTSGSNKAQIVRVPQYSTCDVTGTVTPISGWNGSWGGILAVMCKEYLVGSSLIDLSGMGFRGTGHGPLYRNQTGVQGEGSGSATVTQAIERNGTGGGGGYGRQDGGGGGGGGNGSIGIAGSPNGGEGQTNGHPGGYGGSTAGTAALSEIHFGGAGGEGGADEDGAYPGRGGNGGGIVVLIAKTITGAGTVKSRGVDGANGCNNGCGGSGSGMGGGGAGAGGSILVRTWKSDFTDESIQAPGGSGGAPGGTNPGGYGGAGGTGRIRIEYCDSLTGTTNPPASTQKLSCYIAEQQANFGGMIGRLNLPTAVTSTTTYRVQYGRRLSFTGPDTVTTTLRVPAGLFSMASLDLLASGLGATTPFTIWVGDDVTADWSGSVASGGAVSTTALASSFNAYWMSRGAPSTGTLDVPVRVAFGGGGQVLLTNLQMMTSNAALRSLRLTADTYRSASLDYVVTGTAPSGVTIAADVGNDGSIDWTASSTASLPLRGTTGDLSASVSAYLSSRSGEVDVPIRFYVTPATAGLAVTGYRAAPAAVSDASIVAGDVSFSSNNVTEGDTVNVQITPRNVGVRASRGYMASVFAALSGIDGLNYVGSAFVPPLAANGSASLQVPFSTFGFTGTTAVRVVLDPLGRLSETLETNNAVTVSLPIATRPDVQVVQLTPSNAQPVVGEPISLTATIRNTGQRSAAAQSVRLYLGSPDDGAVVLATKSVAQLNGTLSTTVGFTWTPTRTAEAAALYVVVDAAGAVSESDEDNNRASLVLPVGFGGARIADSGSLGADPAYTSTVGYGYIDDGQPDALYQCGADPDQTFRRDPGGRVLYRFDDLQPGRYYHLDLSLYECGLGVGRQESVLVDGVFVAGPVDLSEDRVKNLSLLLDPALYADRSISVTIEEASDQGALVNHIALREVDYRYVDSGSVSDAAYSSGRGFGWLDDTSTLGTSCGTLPMRTSRVDQNDNELRYRFDRLSPTKRYRLRLSFYQCSNVNVVQRLLADGTAMGGNLTLLPNTLVSVTQVLPRGAYADGSAIVSVLRMNAGAGAMVSEIALEETIDEQLCSVRDTLQRTIAYGSVTIDGKAAPAGTMVVAENPRGEVVGCQVLAEEGVLSSMNVYGEDAGQTPAIPGMRQGEVVRFRVDGVLASTQPWLTWTGDDGDLHEIAISTARGTAQTTLLKPGWNFLSLRVAPPMPFVSVAFDSIEGKYCRIFGQGTASLCAVSEDYRTLKQIDVGASYYVNVTSTQSVNLLVEGVAAPVTRPIPLKPGANWIGYLPAASLPVSVALQSIAGKYVRMFSITGTVVPQTPTLSTLTRMDPGQGYAIYVTQPVTLIYPAVAATSMVADIPDAASRPEWDAVCRDVRPTPSFTVLYGRATLNGLAMPPGTIVRALAGDGALIGCAIVGSDGEYGAMMVYDIDEGTHSRPPDGPIRLQFGPFTPTEAGVEWSDDADLHRSDASVTGWQIRLPMVGGGE